MTVRAIVHDGRGGVRVDDVPSPHLRDDEDAIVRVTRMAVCGTDLHLLAHRSRLPEGTVLGHEFVGRIEQVGQRVAGVRQGDLVVGSDYVACGHCRWCRTGDHWHCRHRRFLGTGAAFGPELTGAQAELVRIPYAATSLRLLPERADRDDALLLGDVLATGYAAAVRLAIRPGSCVVVIGGGPVGQLAATCAQALGAGVVVVAEPVESRRAVAVAAGSLAADPDSVGDLVTGLTDSRGADGVIDAVGGATGLDAALGCVRNAGRIVSVGVPAQPDWRMPVAAAFEREVSVSFAVGNLMRDGDVLLDLLASGLVAPAGLMSDPMPLQDAPKAYRAMQNRAILKAVLRP